MACLWKLGFSLIVGLAVAGCATQAPTFKEVRTQSARTSEVGAAAGGPFCLHVKYHNNWYYAYSENYAEAWVTDGACEAGGPRRAVQALSMNYRYKGEGLGGKNCPGADSCSFSERNYGIAKEIECASGSASDSGWGAHYSTDPIGCP